jgi:hypothetical protein
MDRSTKSKECPFKQVPCSSIFPLLLGDFRYLEQGRYVVGYQLLAIFMYHSVIKGIRLS